MKEKQDLEEDRYMDFISSAFIGDGQPFGMDWPLDKVAEFLKRRGYRILKREDLDNGKYEVAVKSDEDFIPLAPNLISIFKNEVQDIIINILLRNQKNED